MSPKLSILIPARNEPYLQKTIHDICENSVGDIEIIVGLDGYEDTLTSSKPLVVVHSKESIGQRAMTNILASRAKAPYVMKTDAHCSFGYGFDEELLKDMDKDIILSPYMLVLDVDNWKARTDKKSSQYVFNKDFVMLYAPEKDEALSETMCLQGSCFVVSKDIYFKWVLGDTPFGSWGGQGVELGIKAFLNGGKCMTTKRTYYAHMFRTTGADFPYDRGQEPGKHANEELKRRFNNQSIAPLIKKFNYPADWTPELLDLLPLTK